MADIDHMAFMEPGDYPPNLTSLSVLTQQSVLSCLSARYLRNLFYTSAGSTIIALNPFKDMSALYCPDEMCQYLPDSNEQSSDEPHIFSIGCCAYNGLCHDLGNVNQSIIISGESGAGKTVTARHLLKYLTVVSNHDTDRTSLSESHIEQRILDSNPLLEAFGNAATPRNDNSSRFGKFIQLQYRRGGHIEGARINTYLLEKTRVAHQSDGECNFHIFYQMLQGLQQPPLSDEMTTMIEDLTRRSFRILPAVDNTIVNQDVGSFQRTLEALSDIGILKHLQIAILEVLSAVLFLGNIDFEEEDDFASVSPASQSDCRDACRYLGVSCDDLRRTLVHRNIASSRKARQSMFVKPVMKDEANARRDCLSMLLYSRLFHWLVSYINTQIEAKTSDCFIGLLDIYGFEQFESNSLEQLCINYANEKLQQHYVQHFLRDLQAEYEEERISWTRIDFTDNQPCLGLIEGRAGIFALLNEEVYLCRQSDVTSFQQRILDLRTQHSSHLKEPTKRGRNLQKFVICHYAGAVSYNTQGLVEKNKDNIPTELVDLLKASHKPFISHLFHDMETQSKPGRKQKTVLSKFKTSLDSLMQLLSKSDVHYIRCIKPNTHNEADMFDDVYVLNQLAAGGIVETVKICQSGYPARLPYQSFMHRYGILMTSLSVHTAESIDHTLEDVLHCNPLEQLSQKEVAATITSPYIPTPKKRLRRRAGFSPADHSRRCCLAILNSVFYSTSGFHEIFKQQFGRTKLFLKQEQIEQLEVHRTRLMTRQACSIQRIWRGHCCRVKIRRYRRAIIIIQKRFRQIVRNRKQKELEEERKALEQKRKEESKNVSLDSSQSGTTLQPSPGKRSYSVSNSTMTNQEVNDTHEMNEHSDVKRPRKVLSDLMQQHHTGVLNIGDGIVTRRRLPRVGIRFHTRTGPLKNAHCAPLKDIQCSLADCLNDS